MKLSARELELRLMRERRLARTTAKNSRGEPKPAPNVAEARRVPSTPRGTKLGRPRIEDQGTTLAATMPWKDRGMSKATWYRRQKEKS
jgi:hypothetical protein